MSDRIPWDLRWKWFFDDVQAHWRRIHRLYITRAYSWAGGDRHHLFGV